METTTQAIDTPQIAPRADARHFDLGRIPDPDYTTHPAYGGAFAKPSIPMRARAIAKFAPWFGFVTAKWLLMFDRLPPLSDYAPAHGGIGTKLRVLPIYAPVIASGFIKELWHALFRRRPIATSRSGQTLHGALDRSGIVVTSLSGDDMNRLRSAVAPALERFVERRNQEAERTFESNQFWLTEERDADVYETMRQVLSENSILEAAAAYLGRPVELKLLLLQINGTDDHFQHNKFADVGLPDPPTNYMHIDTSQRMLKCVVALGDITEKTGPFSYVLGSAQVKIGTFEGLLRRSIDRSGLSGYDPGTRELFAALPRPLRRKATFGADLLTESPETKAIVDAEYRFVSADGNVAIFDNIGIHRGALVEEGERRVLFATLA